MHILCCVFSNREPDNQEQEFRNVFLISSGFDFLLMLLVVFSCCGSHRVTSTSLRCLKGSRCRLHRTARWVIAARTAQSTFRARGLPALWSLSNEVDSWESPDNTDVQHWPPNSCFLGYKLQALPTFLPVLYHQLIWATPSGFLCKYLGYWVFASGWSCPLNTSFLPDHSASLLPIWDADLAPSTALALLPHLVSSPVCWSGKSRRWGPALATVTSQVLLTSRASTLSLHCGTNTRLVGWLGSWWESTRISCELSVQFSWPFTHLLLLGWP